MAGFDAGEVARQVMYRIANAPVRTWPFPHVAVEEVFPPDFYAALIEALPPTAAYASLSNTGRVDEATADAYRQRHTIDLVRPEPERFPEAQRAFWSGFLDWLIGERFAMFALEQFGALVNDRFGPRLREARFFPEFQLVHDVTGYALGPHTDRPDKVVVFLFYLARPGADERLGTSLYVPREDGFSCDGGPHHPRERFFRVVTMAYRPNTMMGFFKTARSFHGVEPVATPGAARDLIQLSFCHRLPGSPGVAPVPR